jgi:hypothetical protein
MWPIEADRSEADPSRVVVKNLIAILASLTVCNYIKKSYDLRFKHHTNDSKTAGTILCSRTVATCFPTSTISFIFSKSLPACLPASLCLLASCLSHCSLCLLSTSDSACYLVLTCLCCLSLGPLPAFVPVSLVSLLVFSLVFLHTLLMVSIL